MILTSDDIDICFGLIKNTIDAGLKNDSPITLNQSSFSPSLIERKNTFVCYKHLGEEIGRKGNIFTKDVLYNSILTNAFRAGFRDTRFPPLNENILSELLIEFFIFEQNSGSSIILDIDEFCNSLSPNECVYISYKDIDSFMLSTTQSTFSNKLEFMNALKDKAKIDRAVPWHFIRAGKIITQQRYERKYSEIK